MKSQLIHKKHRYKVHHLATGGTLDSEWFPSGDTAKANIQTFIPSYLQEIRLPRHTVQSETLCLKDSREINIVLQNRIADTVAESAHRKILVTAGTYSMPDIAQSIQYHPAIDQFRRIRKNVVITGSLIPMKNFLLSDGGFNIGMSMAVLQEDLKEAVSLVMNGMCIGVSRGVKKDLTTPAFHSTNYGELDLLGYQNFTIIPAGGSIDFELDGIDGLKPSAASYIPRFLRENVQIQRDFDAINPFVKDSRDLKERDLSIILDAVKSARTQHILITTGFFKIRTIQQYLSKNLSGSDKEKKVILTGSRFPLKTTDMTDATYNLGYALGIMAFVDNGVHIALNGMLLDNNDDIIKLLFTKNEERRLLKESQLQTNV